MAGAPGRIVILNGAPRSGKSSLAEAIQAAAGEVWINLGVDTMMAATPEHWRPGIGLRPGGERPDLEPVVSQLYAALFDSIAAHSRLGVNVVADLGIHDGYSRPLGIWDDLGRRLAGLPVLRVGVFCPIEVVMARRNADPRGGFYAAGSQVPPPVGRWQEEVHRGHDYHLTLDTAALSPADGAALIMAALHRERGASG
jgi:chloramphenicol 3-O phosphotransferase